MFSLYFKDNGKQQNAKFEKFENTISNILKKIVGTILYLNS